LRLAPNYVEKSLQRTPQDIAAAGDVLQAFYDGIGLRMDRTQDARVREVMNHEVLIKYDNTGIEPSDSETTKLANSIKYVLPDFIATYLPEAAEQDDDHFIQETFILLDSKMSERMNQLLARNKEGTKPKKTKKRKGKKCFLDRMD